jgi:hypothetical protein
MQDDNPYALPKAYGTATLQGDACIQMTRTTSYADRIRAYRILIDGREAARITAGETVEVPVMSGTHSVVARVDWCGSPTRHFSVDAGKTVQFECGSNLRGLRIFLAIVYVLFLRDEYLTLDQV